MRYIIDDEHLRVGVINNPSDSTVLCFSGIGEIVRGVDIQSPEFVRASNSNGNAIFIIDKDRSWGNNFSLQNLFNYLKPYTDHKQIYALGNSMGGFLAILASKYIKISVVVAFVPQYSISKKQVPNEDRWEQYTKNILEFKYESLENCFLDDTQYYIVSGNDRKDRQHWERFPSGQNIHKLILRQSNRPHQAAQHLKDLNKMYPFINDCFCQKAPDQIVLDNDLTDLIDIIV